MMLLATKLIRGWLLMSALLLWGPFFAGATTTVAPPLSSQVSSVLATVCVDRGPPPPTTTTPGTTTTVTTTTVTTTTATTTSPRRLDIVPEDSSVGNLNLVVPEEASSYGNLRAVRSRNLNGWFDCGSNTHCVKNRATCAVDANGIGICTCMNGYGGSECQPVNECEIDSPCPGGSVCVDMFPPMRFKCVCKDGFTPFLPNELPNEPDVPVEYRPTSCIDIIECDDETNPPCHPDATCTNTIGNFECACNEGLAGNGITTCNTQEVATATEAPPDGSCMTSTDCQGSNMQCVNSTCACLPGYALVGANCQNEVNCDAGGRNNDCHRRATCTEEDGFPGFSCACIEGWEDAFEEANGKSCKNIPPITEAPPPPEPVTEAVLPAGVGPHPNRPTVFQPTCLAPFTDCVPSGGTPCCGAGVCMSVLIVKPTTSSPITNT